MNTCIIMPVYNHDEAIVGGMCGFKFFHRAVPRLLLYPVGIYCCWPANKKGRQTCRAYPAGNSQFVTDLKFDGGYFNHVREQLNFPGKTREQASQHGIRKFAERLRNYCSQEPLQWFDIL